jgi:hypothetical protein
VFGLFIYSSLPEAVVVLLAQFIFHDLGCKRADTFLTHILQLRFFSRFEHKSKAIDDQGSSFALANLNLRR